MNVNNEFVVGVPIEEAWQAMLDLQRIAPCLPGASIDERDGENHKGTMRVKVGPITAKYQGTVRYEEVDERTRRAVLHATGRDASGQGTASATITSNLEEAGDRTRVSVQTEMKLTGRAAQFGRGVAQDVTTKMLGRFGECLEQELGGGGDPGASGAAKGTAGEPEAFDLGAAGGRAVLKRAVPVAAALVVLAGVSFWLFRNPDGRSSAR
ncbi:MAG: SRPBCC family protein [Actinomycetota bacterium]|nr:SRPBCC family protein [Actinomycetota bacterium]